MRGGSFYSFNFPNKYLLLGPKLELLKKFKIEAENQQTVKSKCLSPLCSKGYKYTQGGIFEFV